MRSQFLLLFLVVSIYGQTMHQEFLSTTPTSNAMYKRDESSMEEIIESIHKVDKEVHKTFQEAKAEVINSVPPSRKEEAIDSIKEAEKEVKLYARRFLFDMIGRATSTLGRGIHDFFGGGGGGDMERETITDRDSKSNFKYNERVREKSKGRGKGRGKKKGKGKRSQKTKKECRGKKAKKSKKCRRRRNNEAVGRHVVTNI